MKWPDAEWMVETPEASQRQMEQLQLQAALHIQQALVLVRGKGTSDQIALLNEGGLEPLA